jgi:tRNA modification GTPase
MKDTIAAISTPLGEGGIAIIRMSGPMAFAIADWIFVSRRGKPSEFPTHTIHFGTIGHNSDLVDQVMLTVMRAPRTYTAEDVIEINCHGGLLTANNILSLCLQHGAQLAEPGEFTKRAFLNGRIDLTQAEAVMDLIRAKTDRAHGAAAHALEGHLATKINKVRDRLLTTLAHVEAHLDFPDEDITPDTREQLLANTESTLEFLQKLLATAHEGKILRDGIAVAIIGRPNVGKSSLMNALLGQDRSIVTPIPGTTRDSIEEIANIRGIPVRLTDTAGIRKPRGTIEEIGVQRSRKSLAQSTLVLHVIDSSRPFCAGDDKLADHCAGKQTIIVLNKIDLPRKLIIPEKFPRERCVKVSATRGDGLELLKNKIESLTWSGAVAPGEFDVAVNERHADAIRRAIKSLVAAVDEISRNASLDLVSQQLRIGLDAIGEVVGKTTTEDIVNKVFSTFCIGK